MKNQTLAWEILGMIFTIFVGSFFHFIFELSGGNIIIGAISPVNESVWEHLKLAYIPLLLFSLLQYYFLKKSTNNFVIAKTVATFVIPLIIVISFYTYVAILGEDSLFFDIFFFALSIIIGYLISYKILISEQFSKKYSIICLIALIVYGALFVIFTFYTPNLFIFQDSITGQYGIIENH